MLNNFQNFLGSPLLTIGVAMLMGFFVGRLAEMIKLPRVTGYVIAGVILGHTIYSGSFDLLRFDITNDFALGFVAFTIGAELEIDRLKKVGLCVATIVIFETLVSFILVSFCTFLLTKDLPLSVLLGSLASATAPAATVMTLRQMKAKGPVTTTLLAVVGLDDALALIVYAFAAAFLKGSLNSDGISIVQAFILPLLRILGALGLGGLLGLAMLPVLKSITLQAEMLLFVCASIIFCDGLATRFGFSELLCNMAFGFTVANVGRFSTGRLLNAIDQLTPPIYAAFFVLAGAQLRLNACCNAFMLSLAAVYTLSRIVGKVGGAYLGSLIGKASDTIRKNIGYGLVSQVGIAIALAVIIRREFRPLNIYFGNFEMSQMIINLLLFTTIFTEIIGPALTRYGIRRAGEDHSAE